MSRVAKSPVVIPAGVEVKFGTEVLTISGKNGELSLPLSQDVNIALEEGQLTFTPNNDSKHAGAMSGTLRALVNNMVKGVAEGFEKKLQLIGVGYRAQAQGQILNLSLGFSHPVAYELPEGVTAVTPSQTEIVISGADKQKVGQVAAEVRGYRPPEPYKGKGVRYADEKVVIKETKKK
ncbi:MULTISPECIES: 50S ribosomal protein L6 [Vitreoscilla]|uniref:Large ribosomal subunit protein uL6 n=1 Tax=Vitreoscilla stercoraria TaxID=61 RepID=A0ABY4EBF4_VITST|nr:MULTISPECIES: 50S ribosomal protein L6 [Vitreoscilla]AUZ06481.1 50S ribosomal protein L6 [Vitreoscilla sp. C1]UOO92235.1 50S ribosomal protein L6 [Vitreoscilla stercoraria]